MSNLVNSLSLYAAYHNCSKGKWIVLPNSSWGDDHKNKHGNHPGFVICHYDSHNQLVVIADIIVPFKKITSEIEANAKLMALAPELAKALIPFTVLNEDHYKDIAGFIKQAKEIVNTLD